MSTFETRTNLLWSGENPIILLKMSAEAVEHLAVGFFRVDYSPSGTGHAVFIAGDLGGAGRKDDRVFACYTDRAAVAQWVLATTVTTLPEFKNHDLHGIPIKPGRFASVGDTRSRWTEIVSTDDGEVALSWADLQPPFNLRVPIGAVATIPYEINTIIYSARIAEVRINGRTAAGKPFPDRIGNQPHSTAFLALSETWYRP